jgi:flagellar basal body rod protein FlgC
MKAAQNLFEANLKTLNTNDNMLGRILDIEA